MDEVAGPPIHGGDEAIGDYRLLRLIARGGMGLVYEAHHPPTGRVVALKVLSREEAAGAPAPGEQLAREVQAAIRLEHPNVLPVYEAGEADGQLFIAMRLVEGEDLGSILAREGPLTVGRALEIVEQIASALDAACAIGLVHGDVKPGNVMIEATTDGHEHCWVLDFGLAVDPDIRTFSADGVWSGTPGYVAPEHLRGEGLDGRADVYALGVLIFHALAGNPPFAREHDDGTLLAHLHAPPPSLARLRPELPRSVDAVIERALEKRPDARYSSAGELAADLRRALCERRAGADTTVLSRTDEGNPSTGASRLIGRFEEMRELGEALSGTRLLSIAGPGGVGKTTLAIHLAASVACEYAGAWVVGLDAVHDGAGAELEIARILGLRMGSAGAARDALVEFLGARRLLLVLDSCEHLVEPVGSLIAELLDSCPGLTVIVTSRERLTIDGELVHALAPLEVPADDDEPEDILASDSATLLRARAAEQGIAVGLEPESAGAIARICARLEGMPLALELAAAQLRTLSPESLAARLEENLGVLSDSTPAGTDRTLDAVIDSSWRLMDEEERAVLVRLGVFTAAFDLDAAEAVAAGHGNRISTQTVLARLAEKSLLQRDASGGGMRFRMLLPVREFALARLSAGVLVSARAAHRVFYEDLADRASSFLDGPRSPQWLVALDADHRNIRSALESAMGDGDAEGALRIGAAMRRYWAARGLAAEGIALLRQGLLVGGAEAPPALRARAHSALGHLAAVGLGDIPTAECHAAEALRLARSAGDTETAAEALTWLSWCASFAGRAAEGLVRAKEGLVTAGETASPAVVGRLLDAQAIALEQAGETAAARSTYEQARDVFARAGYATGVASVENHLGDLALGTGELPEATARFSSARSSAEAAGDDASVAMAALNLALIDQLAGRREDAREHFLDCLLTNRACGDQPNIAFSIFGLALAERESAPAAELHANAAHRLAQLEITLSPLEARLQADELARLQADLGAERFERLTARGRGLSIDEIVEAVEAAD